MKVAIFAEGFIGWSGGRDLIATIADGLEASDQVDTVLLITEYSLSDKFLGRIKDFIKSKGNWGYFRKLYTGRAANEKLLKTNESLLIEVFRACSPDTKIVKYMYSANRFMNTRTKKLKEYVQKNGIDIIMPQTEVADEDIGIPVVGYLYDFQHKYLLDFFSQEERAVRDRNFERQIEKSRYLVVDAEDVKKDIYKFFPDYKGKVIVLPFKPFQTLELEEQADLGRYELPEKYYVICNQFWIHKSHRLAFAALEKIFNGGHQDIHLVCTGKMEDNRFPQYIQELKEYLSGLNCKDNIHLTGFIPKKDQLQIMDRAIALVQPTLFEGGPGGGSVRNALCLGVPCIVSDIKVNQEITGYENVYFFQANNADDLADVMLEHIHDKHLDRETVKRKVVRNKQEYADELLSQLLEIIDDYKKAEVE
ncbi:MAG: glycosyltransferase [Blautia sp.]|nr:glycosyltransferase [Blautia sp.]MCM1201833.1 glycosyltransferase [Bacteroides fragilis]